MYKNYMMYYYSIIFSMRKEVFFKLGTNIFPKLERKKFFFKEAQRDRELHLLKRTSFAKLALNQPLKHTVLSSLDDLAVDLALR